MDVQLTPFIVDSLLLCFRELQSYKMKENIFSCLTKLQGKCMQRVVDIAEGSKPLKTNGEEIAYAINCPRTYYPFLQGLYSQCSYICLLFVLVFMCMFALNNAKDYVLSLNCIWLNEGDLNRLNAAFATN